VPNPTPGTLLGAYRVEGQLGAGSMGEVFSAIDSGLNRRVAVKILSEKHRDSPELRQRFVREGRAVAAISHPNVVQVFATGSFDERPYIAMELLDGKDLGSTVEQAGALSSKEAAHAVLDAAQGLAAASKAGLIHRDVKPSNLVRLSDGKVKVTDFGLAKPVEPGSEPALTAMGVVVGTPDYIAPEQARGETIDERVDIYALGGTLYFLLTAVPPFRTGKPADDKYLKVVARHLRNPAPEAQDRNPAVDRELAGLARQMMAKKPGERPSYAELIQRLTGILARLDPDSVPELIVSARERSRPNLALPSGPSASLSAFPDRAARGLPVWLLVFTIACVALFVTGLVVYLHRQPPAPDKSSTAPAPPSGMLLVTRPDGSPWLYVDARPVTADAYRAVFAGHEGSGDAPVTMVSYDQARSFAGTHERRLLRDDEWQAAAGLARFVVADGLYEWVEGASEGRREVRAKAASQIRSDAPQNDVTFRMAKDI
jgi:serine/threonine-protein kinase